MKKIVMMLFVIGSIISCSNGSDDAMDIIVDEMGDDMMMSTNNYSMGDFVSGAHVTTGKASVNFEKTILSLSSFKTDTGPKLLVYLATDASVNDYISLGDLKGVNGNYIYTIPDNSDLEKYNRVDIWCVDFSVSFGHALLKIN
tara:strand:+ start:69718 stop:70146 length:429 start_codon:yes stop_codon:yes gene_type:complete